MTPLQHFEEIWSRIAHLNAVHAYLAGHATAALKTDELLRAEWAARVGALDLYMHELSAQRVLEVFNGHRVAPPAYFRLQLSLETVVRISTAATPTDAAAAFDLAIRDQQGRQTFQLPDDIASAVRCFSPVELWSAVAGVIGRPPEVLKLDLKLIVRRRNFIVHEGDLQPGAPRTPRSISAADLVTVRTYIEQLVRTIDGVAA